MPGRRVPWSSCFTLAIVLVIGMPAWAQSAAEPDSLNAEVIRLHRAGKYAEAVSIAQRVLSLREQSLGPEHPAVAEALNTLADLYKAQGHFLEAEQLYKRSLTIREKALGMEHPQVGQSLNNLALLYHAQARTAEAEPLYRRSLLIAEKALGPEHPNVAASLGNLGGLYEAQGRLAEAEPLYQRSLVMHEKLQGPENTAVAAALNNLAGLYRRQGRYLEAEPLYKRSVVVAEKALGPEHPHVATSLNNLASLKEAQGHLAEAEALYLRSLAIREKAQGSGHLDVAGVLNNLAGLYLARGRTAKAEPLYRRSLAIYEKALGLEHPNIGQSLNNLASLYKAQGRTAEAESLFRRSLAIYEKALGPEHLAVAGALNNLAGLYRAQGRTADAEPLYRRSLAIYEKLLEPEHPHVATSLNNLAALYEMQGRLRDAEPLHKRSLAIREKALGPQHQDVAVSLNNLAGLYATQRRLAEAEPLYRRGLAISEKALGPEHPNVIALLDNLAWLALGQSDWGGAVRRWRDATALLQRRTERGLDGASGGSSTGEDRRNRRTFEGLVKTTYRLAIGDRGNEMELASELFETAQWGQRSAAASSLAQMAARSAGGSPELATVVRERQDLVAEWSEQDKRLIASRSELPSKRDPSAEKALSNRLTAIDRRLATIDTRLAKDFPDYAALASPKPISVADVQAALDGNEALVLFFVTDDGFKPLTEETFVWVVTKSEVRWVRSELGTVALRSEIAALRCGLDAVAWSGSGAWRCYVAHGPPPRPAEAPRPLPFDHARAHRLYVSLFGKVRDLIKGKHLLIVPSGPLTQFPFHALVARSPGSNKSHQIAWLARDHAITVLPSVSSLKALRRVAKPSAATLPMIGFGNPLLNGPDAHYADSARLAQEKLRCPETTWQRPAARTTNLVGIEPFETRGGMANVAHIKAQVPLPETADELCAVARNLNVDARDIRLGPAATEREVKRLSTRGELKRYRMVHFATHGVMAGELDRDREPGLILTPPETASEVDDGYLSASEIASLKLDADWVVLSACNTAAGSTDSAEALSGLGRAFIYAGTRTLLVSHWSVYSDATVKLVTGASRELGRDAKVGRAEAMRRAMLALIDNGSQEEAHPAFWAPFVVVGEGGASR